MSEPIADPDASYNRYRTVLKILGHLNQAEQEWHAKGFPASPAIRDAREGVDLLLGEWRTQESER